MPRGSDRARRRHAASAGATLYEAGGEVSNHGANCDACSDAPLRPRTRATIVVKPSDTTRPRTVLEDPNTGCPSHSLRPPSSGALKRSLSNFAANTGLPFATPSRSRTPRVVGLLALLGCSPVPT